MKRINLDQDKLYAVARRVKELRKALNISQKDFAASLNISASYLSEIEHGNANPGIEFFYLLSNTCGVSLDYLFHGVGEVMMKDKFHQDIKSKERKLSRGIETMDDLLWLAENSTLFKNSIMGLASKFYYENVETIKKSLEIPGEEAEENGKTKGSIKNKNEKGEEK